MEKYNRYYRLAYSYVHNETDAFDIVQNGVYKALRSEYEKQQMSKEQIEQLHEKIREAKK